MPKEKINSPKKEVMIQRTARLSKEQDLIIEEYVRTLKSTRNEVLRWLLDFGIKKARTLKHL